MTDFVYEVTYNLDQTEGRGREVGTGIAFHSPQTCSIEIKKLMCKKGCN